MKAQKEALSRVSYINSWQGSYALSQRVLPEWMCRQRGLFREARHVATGPPM